jgi:hypothetical protein
MTVLRTAPCTQQMAKEVIQNNCQLNYDRKRGIDRLVHGSCAMNFAVDKTDLNAKLIQAYMPAIVSTFQAKKLC